MSSVTNHMVFNWAMNAPVEDSAQRSVLLHLAACYSTDSRPTPLPDLETLAKRSLCTPDEVKEAIERLIAVDLLETLQDARGTCYSLGRADA